jgi:hypothetical protein
MRILSAARLLVAAAIVVSASGCVVHSSPAITGSGTPQTESRDVASFGRVSVGGALHAEITVGPAAAVQVTGDDNLVPLVRADVVGDELRLTLEENVRPKVPLRVIVTAPKLAGVRAGGASSVKAVGIDAERLDADASGASSLDLAGRVSTLKGEVSGASSLRARGLAAAVTTLDVAGASSAAVNCTGRLSADVSGASSLTYFGKPGSVEPRVSGASTVRAGE